MSFLNHQKKKDKAKKKMTMTEESADCDPPAPKKLKREKMDTANGTVQSSPDVNGNIRKKPVKVQNLHSSDELVNPAGEPPEVIVCLHDLTWWSRVFL